MMVIGRYTSMWMGVFLVSVILCTLSKGLPVQSKKVPQLGEEKEETFSQPTPPTNNTNQSHTTSFHNVTESAVADTSQNIESAADTNDTPNDTDNSLPHDEEIDDTSEGNDDASEVNDDASDDNNVPDEVTNTENESVNKSQDIDQNEVIPTVATSKQNDTQDEQQENVEVDPQDDPQQQDLPNLPTGETTTESGEKNLSTKSPEKTADDVDKSEDTGENADDEQVIEEVDGETADEEGVEKEGMEPDKQPTVDDKEHIHEQHTQINEYIFVHTGDTATGNDESNFSFLRLFLVATVFFILFYVGYYHKHRIMRHFSGDSSEIYYHPLRTMQHNAVD